MKNFNLKDKHVLAIMTLVCAGLIVMSLATQNVVGSLQSGASYLVEPFQVSINKIGTWFTGISDGFKSAKELADENKELKDQISRLTEQNNNFIQQQDELERLEALYKLDSEFPEYDKVAATVISKDPGNWYNTFVINKGSEDGIEVDMNVLGGGGLVGIVTETGRNWSKVRSIIDDESNVSAMINGKALLCTVAGSLKDMNNGKITFFGLQDPDELVTSGDMVVTSNISEKFLPGFTIGYISDIEKNSNNLTKSGTIIPASDFTEIREVLVVMTLKNTGEDTEESGESGN